MGRIIQEQRPQSAGGVWQWTANSRKVREKKTAVMGHKPDGQEEEQCMGQSLRFLPAMAIPEQCTHRRAAEDVPCRHWEQVPQQKIPPGQGGEVDA